jgi:anti-anti-sigma factor
VPSGSNPQPRCPTPGQLKIKRQVSGRCHILALSGELDIASAPELHATVGGALPEAREIILDVQELTFLESTGLRSILACQTSCQQAGTAFLMTPAKTQARRVFEISGVLDRLPFTYDAHIGIPPG